jgi:hypothetical protein
VPSDVILREQPSDATNGVIASILIDDAGAIHTIKDGGVESNNGRPSTKATPPARP